MSIYLQEFNNKEDIISRYCGTSEADLEGATVHIAWYGYGDYCGSSIVVYEKDGRLYEVNASHCSCNGLEDCWDPEETSWEALKTREPGSGSYEGEEELDREWQALVEKH